MSLYEGCSPPGWCHFALRLTWKGSCEEKCLWVNMKSVCVCPREGGSASSHACTPTAQTQTKCPRCLPHTHTHTGTPHTQSLLLSRTEHTLTDKNTHTHSQINTEMGEYPLGVGRWGVGGRDIHPYWFINETRQRWREDLERENREEREEGKKSGEGPDRWDK